MTGVIQIEEPFHPICRSFLTIVLLQKRVYKNDTQLNHCVNPAYEEKRHDRIQEDPEHHGADLFFQIAPVAVHGNDRHNGDTAPV